jgi:hypothetical protein
MVSWFNPVQLIKLLLNVVIADIFGQYADRRLIQAALDHETPQGRPPKLLKPVPRRPKRRRGK